MWLNQFKNGNITISKAFKARLSDGQANPACVGQSCLTLLRNLSKKQIQYT